MLFLHHVITAEFSSNYFIAQEATSISISAPSTEHNLSQIDGIWNKVLSSKQQF